MEQGNPEEGLEKVETLQGVVIANSNVEFIEDPQEQQAKAVGSQYNLERQNHGEEISNFFSRPVHLYDLDWDNTFTSTSLSAWYQWQDNKRINNRLANYLGFRGNLHLKFEVIGNPYYYGRMQLSYQPLKGFGGSDVINDTDGATTDLGLQCIRSQRQKIDIDPSISSGAEMTLPYVWPYDYCSVPAFYLESLLMGVIWMDEVVPLRSISNVTGSTPPAVTIRVYGWMENIDLIGTTAFTGVVTPQSGCNDTLEEQQGANQGLVSSKLDTLAGIANRLSSIPGFAPYTTPVEVASRAGAQIAQCLGFSKPLNQRDVERYQPRALDMMTHVVGSDTCVKLALSPNQITTVDPEVLGGDGDEMSLKSIISRPSLFAAFDWDLTNAPGELLYQIPVNPKVAPGAEGIYHYTALGGVAQLFTYWDGSITYRFDVISTAFHRGKLLVVYDPMGAKPTGEAEEVVQYAAVVDISEARSFEVTVGFNSNFGMLPVGPLTYTNDGGVSVGVTYPSYNGNISIYVANTLAIPNVQPGTPTVVEIACYVKGEDDMTFTLPRPISNENTKAIFFANSSPMLDTQLMSSGDTEKVTSSVLSVSMKDTGGVPNTYQGEVIDSLRSLCKRYCHYYSEQIPSSLGMLPEDLYQFTHGAYPAVSGDTASGNYVKPVGLVTSRNTTGFNYPSFIKYAYVAVRGGMRWKYIPWDLNGLGSIIVNRERVESAPLFSRTLHTISEPDAPDDIANLLATYMSGGSLTACRVNNTLEFEIPFQNMVKFYIARSEDNATIALSGSNERFSILGFGTAIAPVYGLFVAAGEDFTVQHFLGWPPISHAALT